MFVQVPQGMMVLMLLRETRMLIDLTVLHTAMVGYERRRCLSGAPRGSYLNIAAKGHGLRDV